MTEHFDDHIRSQLSDYSPEVPSYIWDRIEKQKEEKRRLAFFLWFRRNAKTLIILGTLLVLALLISDPENIGILHPITENRTAPANGPAPRSDNAGTGKAYSLASGSERKLTENTPAQLTTLNEAGNTSTPATRSQESKKVLTGNTRKIIPGTKSPSRNLTLASGRRPKQTGITGGTGDHSGLPDAATKNPDAEVADPDTDEISTRAESGDFSSLLRKQPSGWTPKSINRNTVLVPCPEAGASSNRSYLEFYLGPDHTIRTYKDTANSEYLRMRKENTDGVFSFSGGIRYTKVFNNSVSIRSGINYSSIIEKLNVVEGSVIRVIYILDPNNDTIGNYSTRVTSYRTYYNRYHSIDIPVSMGYEFGNGNLHGNLNAGIIANIYSWQKGVAMDKDYKAVDISTGAPSSPYQFKTNIGLGFIGALSIYYRLQDRYHLMAEPYFRYNLSTATRDEITLKQKFHTVGLRLGIRYDLNKFSNEK